VIVEIVHVNLIGASQIAVVIIMLFADHLQLKKSAIIMELVSVVAAYVLNSMKGSSVNARRDVHC
jgi:hypothetical protein